MTFIKVSGQIISKKIIVDDTLSPNSSVLHPEKDMVPFDIENMDINILYGFIDKT